MKKLNDSKSNICEEKQRFYLQEIKKDKRYLRRCVANIRTSLSAPAPILGKRGSLLPLVGGSIWLLVGGGIWLRIGGCIRLFKGLDIWLLVGGGIRLFKGLDIWPSVEGNSNWLMKDGRDQLLGFLEGCI